MYQFLVWKLLQPFPVLTLLTAAGIILVWRRRRTIGRLGLLALSLPFLLLVASSLPAVAYVLRGSLEWRYPELTERPDDAEAIVVLSGGLYLHDEPRPQAELDEDSMKRCLRAAEVYRQGKPCPIVLSGGKMYPDRPGPACAEVMRDFLLLQQAIRPEDLIVEDRALTTYENAVESCKLLQERGLHKIIVVTEATHLTRALCCFRKLGVDAVPCGCMYRATPAVGGSLRFVPSPQAVEDSQRVCHEWGGLAWYWLRGRI